MLVTILGVLLCIILGCVALPLIVYNVFLAVFIMHDFVFNRKK